MPAFITAIDHIVINTPDLAVSRANYAAIFNAVPIAQTELDGKRSVFFASKNIGVKLVESEDAPGLSELVFYGGDSTMTQRRLARIGLLPPDAQAQGGAGATQVQRPPVNKTRGLAIGFTAVRYLAAHREATNSRAELALDHIVIATDQPEHTGFLFGAQLGLDLRMDLSNEAWSSRLLFFRCGDAIVEIYSPLHTERVSTEDHFFGLTWRVANINATRQRLLSLGFDASDIRKGRKPETAVFTLKSGTEQVPTLFIGPG